VFTASSQTGDTAARELIGVKNVVVRAVFRSEAKAEKLKQDFKKQLESGQLEVVVGPDAKNPESLPVAFKGAEVAIIVTPLDPSDRTRNDSALCLFLIRSLLHALLLLLLL